MINYRTNGAEGHQTRGTTASQRENSAPWVLLICFMNAATESEIGSSPRRKFVVEQPGMLIEQNPWAFV